MPTLIDIRGQRFGNYKVLRYAGHGKWICRCNCGRKQNFDGYTLRNGLVQGCRKCYSKRQVIQIPPGTRFGRLTVLKDSGQRTTQGHSVMWLCKCDCGELCKVWSVNLRGGHTKSCGCGIAIASRKRMFKHGLTETPEYSSWSSMNSRCSNTLSPNWDNYGGRGITICARWRGKDGFINFLNDMGKRPENTSLDRIDVNGNYEPGNCRWATAVVQQNNRRCSVRSVEEESGIA